MFPQDYSQAYMDWNNPTDKKLQLLQELMAPVKCVLFDFDGPICDLFSGYPAYRIADSLKVRLYENNLLTKEIVLENDPQMIFRNSSAMWNSDNEKLIELFLWMEQKLTEDECRAAVTAFPTRLYREFAAYLSEKNIKMAVTTNNSPLAVKLFFKRWYVKEFGNNIFGRTGPNPEDLKPNTLFLLEAMKKLKVHPDRCLLIGDSLTDYLAAKAAGVPFLGFTYTFDRCVVFLKAGAQLVIKSYADLLHALGVEVPYVVSTEGEYLYR